MKTPRAFGRAFPLPRSSNPPPEPKSVFSRWETGATRALLWLALLLAERAHAQYSIDWHTIANGGGVSTGGVYAVSGTIGQHDAGGAMTGEPYSLVGGFWALPTLVQTPGAPTLHIAPAASGLVAIWWSQSTSGFTLQSTDSLSLTNWVNAPTGTNNPATVPATPPARFFRLFRP